MVHQGGNLALMISDNVWMNERGWHAGMWARTLVVLLCQHNAGEVSVSQQAVLSLRGRLVRGRWQTSEETFCPTERDLKQATFMNRLLTCNTLDASERGDCCFWCWWVAHLQGHDRFHHDRETSWAAKVINNTVLWKRNIDDWRNERGGWCDTYSIGTDEHSSISPFALVKAGVVHNPLPCQSERLKRKR